MRVYLSFLLAGLIVHNFIQLTVVVIGMAFASQLAVGAVITADSSVVWQAEIIKKTDVELNIFASNDRLQFKWNPSTKSFSKPASTLLIQAAGKAASTAYSITAQMKRNMVPHLDGLSAGSVEVSASLGGVAIAADKPVLILEGSDKGVKSAAIGLEKFDLSKEGPNTTAKGTYYETDNMALVFSILKGKDRMGTELVFGGTDNGLEKLSDGAYSGAIEIVFVASWTS